LGESWGKTSAFSTDQTLEFPLFVTTTKRVSGNRKRSKVGAKSAALFFVPSFVFRHLVVTPFKRVSKQKIAHRRTISDLFQHPS
jgi:hypothetical protein